MELVRRVTGHATVDVVLKHYFRPGRADFRKALESRMPALLVGGTMESNGSASDDHVLDQVHDLLKKQTATNWEAKRDEALSTLSSATG